MTCTHAGRDYSEGALVCANGRELRCTGDVWQETGYICLMNDNDMEYQKISSDGKIFSDSTSPELAGTSVAAVTMGCCSWILGAPTGYARLYNTCPSCKVVSVDHTNGNVERVTVSGDSYVDVRRLESNTKIIGERDC